VGQGAARIRGANGCGEIADVVRARRRFVGTLVAREQGDTLLPPLQCILNRICRLGQANRCVALRTPLPPQPTLFAVQVTLLRAPAHDRAGER